MTPEVAAAKLTGFWGGRGAGGAGAGAATVLMGGNFGRAGICWGCCCCSSAGSIEPNLIDP